MTPKERAVVSIQNESETVSSLSMMRTAMQQALEALEAHQEYGSPTLLTGVKAVEAITALREALDHSGEANEMVVGWDRVKPEAIASDPLYQQGFVDGVEEGRNQVAEQEKPLYRKVLREMLDAHEQAEQEPVAWTYTRKGIYDKLTELGASITKSCCNVPDKRCGADEWVLQTVQIELLLDALPAPVRTKDLTDDEINELWLTHGQGQMMYIHEKFARAVIAAYKEKNK